MKLIKTHEVREIIENSLNDFEPYKEWKEFILVETESEKHDIVYVNFVEMIEGKLIDNKYKIVVERVCR